VRRGLLALVAAVLLALALPAYGQNFQKGLDAADNGDYATVLKAWRPPAEVGDADAQYNLGVMYYKCRGVAQDHAETESLTGMAKAFFKLAAVRSWFSTGRSYSPQRWT
jgi:hypothetical protein